VAQARSMLREFAHVDGKAPETAASTHIVPADAGGVPAEWVLAEGADPDRRLLWIHGGGWMSGAADEYRSITETLSREAGASVLAIDYRRTPAHPFPAGLDDCETAWTWMVENGPDGAGTARSAFVAGDSAGGNLTLALLLRLRDKGGRAPDAAATISAASDLTGGSPSVEARAHLDPVLNPPGVQFLASLYTGPGGNAANPYISPVMGDLAGLPPLLMHVGENEILFDDTLRFAEKACAAGSPVEHKVWPDMVHVFEIFAHMLPEAQASLAEIAAFLVRHDDRVGGTGVGGP
jgi:monoterpene epsilon-lactone hydrolase